MSPLSGALPVGVGLSLSVGLAREFRTSVIDGGSVTDDDPAFSTLYFVYLFGRDKERIFHLGTENCRFIGRFFRFHGNDRAGRDKITCFRGKK